MGKVDELVYWTWGWLACRATRKSVDLWPEGGKKMACLLGSGWQPRVERVAAKGEGLNRLPILHKGRTSLSPLDGHSLYTGLLVWKKERLLACLSLVGRERLNRLACSALVGKQGDLPLIHKKKFLSAYFFHVKI